MERQSAQLPSTDPCQWSPRQVPLYRVLVTGLARRWKSAILFLNADWRGMGSQSSRVFMSLRASSTFSPARRKSFSFNSSAKFGKLEKSNLPFGSISCRAALLPMSYCLLAITYYISPSAHRRVPIAYCRLPIAHCRFPIARLPIAHCPLPIAYALQPIAYWPTVL